MRYLLSPLFVIAAGLLALTASGCVAHSSPEGKTRGPEQRQSGGYDNSYDDPLVTYPDRSRASASNLEPEDPTLLGPTDESDDMGEDTPPSEEGETEPESGSDASEPVEPVAPAEEGDVFAEDEAQPSDTPDRASVLERRRNATMNQAGTVGPALQWLANQQQADGSWQPGEASPRERVDATALATLAFLGAGYTHEAGTYGNTVRRALRYLVESQRPDGRLAATTEDGVQPTSIPGQYFGTMALAEGYWLTGFDTLRDATEQALAALIRITGPEHSDLTAASSETTAWCLLAFDRCRRAGVDLPAGAIDEHMRIIRPSTSEMTQYLLAAGQRLFPDAVEAETELVSAEAIRGSDATATDLGQRYAASVALRLISRNAWRSWDERAREALQASQHQGRGAADPSAGSWDPGTGSHNNRIAATAISLLTLQVAARY